MRLRKTAGAWTAATAAAVLVVLGAPAAGAGAGASPGEPRAAEAVVRVLPGVAKPARSVIKASPMDAVLAEVRVEEGRRVSAGEVIAVMDDRVARASAEAARAEASRTARLERARAELGFAESNLERVRSAYDSGAATENDLDDASLRAATAAAAVRDAEEQTARAERELELALARVEDHAVRAPFAGTVTAVHAQAGATLQVGEEIATIVSLEELEASVHVPTGLWGRLAVGEVYELRAEEPVSGTVEGELVWIDPVIDPATRTFRCVLRIGNADGELPAGFAVTPVLRRGGLAVVE